MKKIGMVLSIFSTIISANLFAHTSTPIQRIDIVNTLGNANGASQTPVQIAFDNGMSTPCWTATLPFRGALTVFAGPGQNCATIITNVTITPITGPNGMGPMYEAPAPVSINNNFYATQMIISENLAPTFNPTNGALITTGTAQIMTVNNVTQRSKAN